MNEKAQLDRTPAVVVPPRSETDLLVEHYRSLIAGHWQQAAREIIACGEALIEAKAKLPHGRWLPFVSNSLPFSRNVAEKLMKIARVLPARVATLGLEGGLPPHWSTLYKLALLDDRSFKALAGTGLIGADLTRARLAHECRDLGIRGIEPHRSNENADQFITELGKSVLHCTREEIAALADRARRAASFYDQVASPVPPLGRVGDYFSLAEIRELRGGLA